MKNKLFLSFSLLLFFATLQVSPLFAQTISKIDFDGLVDEIICDFTDLSLKEQKGQPFYKDFKKTVESNCDYYTILPFLKGKKPTPSQTIEMVNILHIEYKPLYNANGTNVQMYNNLLRIFEEPEIQAFAKNHPSSYPGFKTDLEGKIKETLLINDNNVDDQIIITDEADLDTMLPPPVQDNTAESPEDYVTEDGSRQPSANPLASKLLFYGFLLLLLAIIGYFSYVAWKKKQQEDTGIEKEKVAKTNKVAVASSSISREEEQLIGLEVLIKDHQMTLANIKKEIEAMHIRLSKLFQKAANQPINEQLEALSTSLNQVEKKQKQLLSLLEQTADDANASFENGDDTEIETTDFTTLIQNNKETETSDFSDDIPVIPTIKRMTPPDLFFLPIPNRDGSFDAENWTAKFEPTESVYRFQMISSTEAEFEFYNDKPTVRRAISGYDVYVKPVCKALNAFDKNATKIVTQVKGIVYKDGSVWKLKEKALVYYE